jgi:hypothetical protein
MGADNLGFPGLEAIGIGSNSGFPSSSFSSVQSHAVENVRISWWLSLFGN